MKASRIPVFRSTTRARPARRQCGVYMVEMLMAIAISSMLAAALVSSMAESERLTSYGQNQLMAATIAQEQLDTARHTPYVTLTGYKTRGWLELKVSDQSLLGLTYANIAPRAVMPQSSQFRGRVYEMVEESQLPAPSDVKYLRVTVRVTWTEGSKNWNYELYSLVFDNGINGTGG